MARLGNLWLTKLKGPGVPMRSGVEITARMQVEVLGGPVRSFQSGKAKAEPR